MLIVQSLGDIPSEPLGGGSARELILGIGRPAIVLLAGVLIMTVGSHAWRGDALSDAGGPRRRSAGQLRCCCCWVPPAVCRASPRPRIWLNCSPSACCRCNGAWHCRSLVAAIIKTLQGLRWSPPSPPPAWCSRCCRRSGWMAKTGRALAVLAVGGRFDHAAAHQRRLLLAGGRCRGAAAGTRAGAGQLSDAAAGAPRNRCAAHDTCVGVTLCRAGQMNKSFLVLFSKKNKKKCFFLKKEAKTFVDCSSFDDFGLRR